ncbi:MAG TPA: phosphatase PAP2 family protein [Solirubrobacterales bacterium]|nr:phosphatase PAP2 family protein [Solirubrobacterales bacterium]
MTDADKRLLAACLASLLALALLAWAVFHAPGVRHLDARVLARVSADRFGGLGGVAHPIADLGNPVPQVLLLLAGLVVALRGGRRGDAVAGLVLVVGADLTTALLKHALAAPRLDSVLGWAQVGEASFPSGHATAAFAMAGAWAFFFVPARWRWPVAAAGFFLASLVALAVIVLRYHFPSDALGGLLVVSAWTCGVLALRLESLSSR